MEKVSQLISYVFHPAFSPLLLMFLLFNLPIYLNYKLTESYVLFVYGVIFLNLIIAPILLSIHLKKRSYITSLLMPSAKERKLPYLITSIFYVLTYFLFEKIDFPTTYLLMFKGACLVVLCLFLLATIEYKISAHLSALGGIFGALVVSSILFGIDISLILMAITLISGLVASSRLILKAHRYSELASGFILGAGMQLLMCL